MKKNVEGVKKAEDEMEKKKKNAEAVSLEWAQSNRGENSNRNYIDCFGISTNVS